MFADTVEKWFSSQTVARGDAYYKQGRVGTITRHRSGLLIGSVRGSRAYLVAVGLARRGSTVVFHADCGCPFGSSYRKPCKHAWALLRRLDELAPAAYESAPRPRSIVLGRTERSEVIIVPAVALGVLRGASMSNLAEPMSAATRARVATTASTVTTIDQAAASRRVTSSDTQSPGTVVRWRRGSRGSPFRPGHASSAIPPAEERAKLIASAFSAVITADDRHHGATSPPTGVRTGSTKAEVLFVLNRSVADEIGLLEIRLFHRRGLLGATDPADRPYLESCAVSRGSLSSEIGGLDRELLAVLSEGASTIAEYFDRRHRASGGREWLEGYSPVMVEAIGRLLLQPHRRSRDRLPMPASGDPFAASTWVVPTATAAVVLPRAAAEGRLFMAREPFPDEFEALEPLAWCEGGAWQFALSLEHPLPHEGARERGAYALRPVLERHGTQLVLDGAESIFEGTPRLALIGSSLMRIESNASAAGIEALAQRHPAPMLRGDLPALISAFNATGLRAPLRLPSGWNVALRDDLEPVPVLQVGRPFDSDGRFGNEPPDPKRLHFELSLQFRYGEQVVSALSPADLIAPSVVSDVPDAEVTIHRRSREAELNASDRLTALGARGERGNPGVNRTISGGALPMLVRTLMLEGWEVIGERGAFRRAGEIDLSATTGTDWFDLHGAVRFGELSSTIAAVLEALKQGQRWVTLGDGTLGLLPEEWLERNAKWLQLGHSLDGAIRFSRAQLSVVDTLLSEHEGSRCDEQLATARGRLRAFERIVERKEPKSFVGELRHYQREGLGWLEFLAEFGFGGCLADDMGLGKTVQLLAHLIDRRQQGDKGPWLVVAPRSLVFNWAREAARFAPTLKVLDHTGAERHAQSKVLAKADLVLTTYGTLLRDITRLREIEFGCAILDEAQIIKSAASQTAKAARLLRAKRRLALTGTPVENRLEDLWSIFEFVNPGMLGSAKAFARLSTGPARRGAPNGGDAGERITGDPQSLATLRRALRPFLLRRTKEKVARELPARTEQTIACELDRAHRHFYDELREHFRASLGPRLKERGLKGSQIVVLEMLLRLRQAACHPGLVDPKRAKEASAKVTTLVEMVDELAQEGHKVLVFSQFTRLLELARAALSDRKITHVSLEGRTTPALRRERVDRFQSDSKLSVFLISLKAGGVGLNLTAADHVMLLDPWWNPAAEAQAIDRTHRIGQTRKVFAYRLIAKNTVEERVLELQQRKRELADAIVSGDAGPLASLTREDLEWLLS